MFLRFLCGVLSIILTVGIVSHGVCGVGQSDNRYYVDDAMWATPPYNSFVRLSVITKRVSNGVYMGYGCTAQYVAKNLIVSAGHCTEDKPIEYRVTNYKGQTFSVRLLHTPYDSSTNEIGDLGDWAIFLVEDSQYYGDAFFDAVTPTQTAEVINAGYGYVRLLTNEDINAIRQILGSEKVNGTVRFGDFLDTFESELTARNIEALDNDGNRLKASKCNIIFEDCSRNITSACNNQRLPRAAKFPQILATTCDSWQGNSGGGYVSGNKLYGICSYGADSFADYRNTDYIASTQQYLDKINEFKRQYPVSSDNTNQNQASQQPVSRPQVETLPQLAPVAAQILPEQQLPSQLPASLTPTPEPTAEEVETLTQQLEEQGNNIMEGVNVATTLSDGGILSLVNNIAEYKVTKSRLDILMERYNAAKEKEQSLANRTLTAATTAATGLGMMAAASAYSEQKADEAAEQDMKAYLATFRCEYGRGQSVKSSAEEITLPGGNELVNYYQEYKALADNLKNTKKALGLRSGIENEIVYDKAESNLYKYSSKGITSGAFTSVSRALTDIEGEDAAAWNAQKEETAKKLKTGAIAAGVGIVGGVAGDYLINHRKGDDSTGTSGLLDGVDGSGLLSGIGGQLGGALGNVAGNGTETQDGVEETPEETPEEIDDELTDTPVPASSQVSEVLSQPWNWLFASKDSTDFDGAKRTVKYQGQDLQKTAEDTIKADTQHVADFLKKDTTNAPMQCITIDSRPESFAEIIKARYEQDLPELVPDIKYEFKINKGHLYGCDDEVDVCDNIMTHVYNRPCGE